MTFCSTTLTCLVGMAAIAAAVSVSSCSRRHRSGAAAPLIGTRAGAITDPTRQRPPDPWPGPKGWYEFHEAESMAFDSRHWHVVEALDGSRDHKLASGGKVIEWIGKEPGDAVANVDVPADGTYLLAIRVGAPLKGKPPSQSLDVTVRQGDSVEYHWPLEQTVPKDKELFWSWFQWVTTRVPLKAGRNTVTLRRGDGVTDDQNQQKVDCLLLTEDLSYEPDHRDFAPQLYARFTVRNAPKPVALAHQLTTGRVRRAPFTPRLAPGQSTAWLNITRFFTGGGNDRLDLTTAPVVNEADYVVDFATAPSDADIFKAVNRTGPGADVQIVVPADGSPPMADFELARQRAELAARLPPVTFGRRPTKFPVLTGLDIAPNVRTDEMRVMDYVGINGRTGLLDAVDLAHGLVQSRLYNVVYYVGPHGHLDPDVAAEKKDLEQGGRIAAASPNANRVQHLKLIDEASAWKLEKLAADDVAQQAFRTWLRNNHFDPFSPEDRARLGPGGVDAATRLVADRSTDLPGLYYYGQRFRASTIVDFFRRLTTLAHEAYPAGIRTTQNFSDGAVLGPDLYFLGNDYFDYFKNDALDVALSEDWTDAGATRELAGWNVALLRAATLAKGQPIHMYVIAYSGRRPAELEIKGIEEISEGAKLLYIYDYMPKYLEQTPGWAETPIMFPTIAELTHEIGAAEDVLVSAMPRHAETAIYYSIPADIWTTGFDSARGVERMYTYLALRHSQIPVDIVSDEQARGGALGGYKVVYLPSEQIDRRDVAVLAAWVDAGGTLVLGPGAGARDEWNRPNPALDQALRLPRHDVEVLETLKRGSALFCTTVKPQGTVQLLTSSAGGAEHPTGDATIVSARQTFTPSPDATVLARFQDSKEPAAVAIPRGKGRVVLEGFFPALDYGCEAYRSWKDHDSTEMVAPIDILARAESVLDPAHPKPESVRMSRADEMGVLPFRYPAALRDFIVAPALSAHVSRPAAASQPEVVDAFLEGKDGWAVPLANVSGSPIEKLDVVLSPGRPTAGVFSSRRGKLVARALPGKALQVSLPLESTDILYGTWK